jgi:hypothetical protein
MTNSEAESGKCPVCHKTFSAPVEVAISRNPLGQEVPVHPHTVARKKLGFWSVFAIMLVCGALGAIVEAAARGLRPGTGTIGAGMGVAFGAGILQGLGLWGKKA